EPFFMSRDNARLPLFQSLASFWQEGQQSGLEALGPVGRDVDEGLFPHNGFRDDLAGYRAKRQTVVGMAEGEPEALVTRRLTDDRHHVRRAGACTHPRFRVQ